jgi:hypothetical protein
MDKIIVADNIFSIFNLIMVSLAINNLTMVNSTIVGLPLVSLTMIISLT